MNLLTIDRLPKPKALATLFILGCLSATSRSETLIFAFGVHLAEPYVIIDERNQHNNLRAGILFDLGQHFGQALQTDVSFKDIRRPLMAEALQTGQVHAYCSWNPDWVSEDDGIHWSVPIFHSQDRFYVQNKAKLSFDELEDLKTHVLGATEGFHYSDALTRLVNAGKVTRIDARSPEQLLKMLSLRRLDLIVLEQNIQRYVSSKLGLRDEIVTLPFIDDEQARHCAYSAKSPVSFARFNQALKTMKQNGTIKNILARYQTAVATGIKHPLPGMR